VTLSPTPPKPRIALALGGGSARGWSHIGVIRALEEAGIRPDIVCGTSIGALVGAAHAAGRLDDLERWVVSLRVRDVLSYMDFNISGGVLKGTRLMAYLRSHWEDRPIEDLPMPFAAVATALDTGSEVWLRSGPVLEAVRASIALPGLFTPVRIDGRWLVDGGLVNPVPVSLARAMDADIVIAVDLASDLLGRHLQASLEPDIPTSGNEWLRRMRASLADYLPAPTPIELRLPSALDVMASSLNIMQVRITRSRMAGDPPDALIAPRMAHFGLMDFHRAAEAIDIGRGAVEAAMPGLRALGLAGPTQIATTEPTNPA
jgi:NTE family protein